MYGRPDGSGNSMIDMGKVTNTKSLPNTSERAMCARVGKYAFNSKAASLDKLNILQIICLRD